MRPPIGASIRTSGPRWRISCAKRPNSGRSATPGFGYSSPENHERTREAGKNDEKVARGDFNVATAFGCRHAFQLMATHYKQPVSVLVIVYTRELDVLLMERADFPEHWQSVTGSIEPGEALEHAAAREL